MTALFFEARLGTTEVSRLLEAGVRHILVRFDDVFQQSRETELALLFARNPDVTWAYAAGAAEYSRRFLGISVCDAHLLARYKNAYVDSVEELGSGLAWAAEMDVDYGVLPLTARTRALWRESWLDLRFGLTLVPRWSPVLGIRTWVSFCGDHRWPLLGIEGPLIAGEGRFVKRAHAGGKLVHRFSLPVSTSSDLLLEYDSASTNLWATTKHLFLFMGSRFIRMPPFSFRAGGRRVKHTYAPYMERLGLDTTRLSVEDPDEIRRANLVAWRAYGARLATIKKVRTLLSARGVRSSR